MLAGHLRKIGFGHDPFLDSLKATNHKVVIPPILSVGVTVPVTVWMNVPRVLITEMLGMPRQWNDDQSTVHVLHSSPLNSGRPGVTERRGLGHGVSHC